MRGVVDEVGKKVCLHPKRLPLAYLSHSIDAYSDGQRVGLAAQDARLDLSHTMPQAQATHVPALHYLKAQTWEHCT